VISWGNTVLGRNSEKFFDLFRDLLITFRIIASPFPVSSEVVIGFDRHEFLVRDGAADSKFQKTARDYQPSTSFRLRALSFAFLAIGAPIFAVHRAFHDFR
jgi:hypothetical protein